MMYVRASIVALTVAAALASAVPAPAAAGLVVSAAFAGCNSDALGDRADCVNPGLAHRRLGGLLVRSRRRSTKVFGQVTALKQRCLRRAYRDHCGGEAKSATQQQYKVSSTMTVDYTVTSNGVMRIDIEEYATEEQ